MYEPIQEPTVFDGSSFARERDPAFDHRGPADRVLQFNRYHCEAFNELEPNWPMPAPYLLHRIIDSRTLLAVARLLVGKGLKGPGPNGRRLTDYTDSELGDFCGKLAKALELRIYKPARPRKVRVPKVGKRGHRTIMVQNVEDRIVSKAATEVLQPLVRQRFWPLSFSVSGKSREEALAVALTVAERLDHWTWVSDDVANAFDRIPFERCMDACRMVGIPDDVVAFLRHIAGGKKKRGILQGAPLSMLLANIFFNHHLDWKWHTNHAKRPLFRYVDDLLVLCPSPAAARLTHASLSRQLINIGTPLKGVTESAVVDLKAGRSIDWLGYRVSLRDGRPVVTIADRHWRRLECGMRDAHRAPCAPLTANALVVGWLKCQGPCYEAENREEVLRRIYAVAAEHAFDELCDADYLHTLWSTMAARWQQVLQDVESNDIYAKLIDAWSA